MSKVISIFGSSRPVEGDAEYLLAYELGKVLAKAGFKVCNGGYGGIMAGSAKGAKEAVGSTIGITTEFYQAGVNPWIDKEIKLPTPMERLFMLVELGDAYVILKGGTGTLLELACVWEFINKKVINEKPIIVVGKFWEKVIETFRGEGIFEGSGDCTRFIRRADSPGECVAILRGTVGGSR